MNLLTLIPETGTYDVYVTRVVDGDTVEACFLVPVKIRLAGCNAPPAKTPRGAEATAWLTDHVAGKLGQIHIKGPYKFGGREQELVADLTVGGADVAKDEIKAGLADPWDGHGPRPGG